METNAGRGIVISWEDLPAPIRAYLPAHQARDTEAAISVFAADAAVTDEGRTYYRFALEGALITRLVIEP
ncbi:hypothetical protein ABZ780_22800 [Micromonospora sp. NPDC047467]|uniref:hypothetical protein n=1 Tax=Micromonospora sp. NPDC047467 TaxID=3154814 RepID=UPI00340A8AAD